MTSHPDPGGPGAGAPPGRVLVAYATRFGSTQGIAERIAARLTAAGHDADLCPCGDVDTVDGYPAVVFGSSVFNQRWLPEADAFVSRNAAPLGSRRLWIFTVGTFGDSKPVIGPLMRHEPRNIGGVIRTLHPAGYRVFAGVIDRHQWPLGSRLFYHALGGRLGDNRDWPAIEAWGDSIAAALARDPQPVATR